jgi:DNA-binding transcriptional MerR regulator
MEADAVVEEMSIGEFSRRTRLSPKALRLYDGLGLLSPARVDELSGYRYYDEAQLEQAWLIGTLRGLEVSLASAKELLTLDPTQMAKRVEEFWQSAELRHDAQRRLVSALVNRLTGRSTVMYEVETREIPQRSLLTLKRNVDEAGTWALGKEFIGHIRDAGLPRMEGRAGAWFIIYWGQVSADSDGPVECCKPVPDDQAEALAAQIPELTLRVEPAHREAYVTLGPTGQTGISPANFQLASEALGNWADAQGIDDSKLTLTPADLGIRITFLYTLPITDKSAPDCDFAIPFA